MIEGSEELKMVLELAASKGRKEAENEMLGIMGSVLLITF